MDASKTKDRAAGAVMGAFIGDALALGPHWYYDLAELRRDYGDWIDGYTAPMPGRYHDGLKAGQLSQAGFILSLMAESLVENNGYNQADFCRRMDEDLFPLLDGTPVAGPGNYTSQSIRDAWRKRVQQNQARAILTGALTGAQVGLSKIPNRFIDGLEQKNRLQKLAESLAQSF
ncbi:ADP-ribosylglycohydrolase family protein [uncultured Desulfobacter sp.]|uniref:ADP-ribosylglycohydrolase family protein n=1 Tax=uncultured Desulfobacter sp. TaxID=240139 RepID=UPI002AA9088D|nr:ADP-ribosylglycohydrolase family protein [uncultured Desulfobacter sp.]